MGKAIYQPKGKAGEYAKYACNFYTGCSNGCTYCYNRKGVFAKTWSDTPKLKKCFNGDEVEAFATFIAELEQNLPELQKHGLFFSFTTDPLLQDAEVINLTMLSIRHCVRNDVPVKVLTKSYWWIIFFLDKYSKDILGEELDRWKEKVAFGWTLTGHDELEPEASTNEERIRAGFMLKQAGFKVWFSFEPVIDTWKSLHLMAQTLRFGDLYKVGLESGRKYDKKDIQVFVEETLRECRNVKIYFKDSLLAQAGINRSDLPANCVGADYNMFNQ